MHRLITLIAGLTLAGAVQAASAANFSGVYQGMLGSQTVVLKVGNTLDTCDGDACYFYLRHGVDIPLTVDASGDQLTLKENPNSDQRASDGSSAAITGILSLTRQGTALMGSWRSPDSKKTLPLKLAPVNLQSAQLALPDSPLLAKWRKTDPYLFLKFNHALRPAAPADGLNWLQEPLSGVKYPRLPNGEPGNAALQDRQLDLAKSALDCQSEVGLRPQDQSPALTVKTTVGYRSARLLSTSDAVDYYCGGAHPDEYVQGLMLDRQSGKVLTVRDLWPQLTNAELNRRYEALYPSKNKEPDCQGVVPDSLQDGLGDDYAAFLSARGLSIWPTYLPHAVLACAETIPLPYQSLSSLAGPLAPH